METQEPEGGPGALLGIAAAVAGGGVLLGGVTNAVNGSVSEHYFRVVLRWEGVRDVPRAAIAQGVFEGLLFGVGFAVVFTLVVGLVTKGRCPFRLAFRHFAGMLGVALGCWVAGGLLGMGLAALSPEFFRANFVRVPEDAVGTIRYAWVGGSIQGAVLGGVLAVLVGCLTFPRRWRRHLEAREGTPDPGGER